MLQPIVIRPAGHLLLIRYRREAAWLAVAGYAWLAFSWYLPVFFPREFDLGWFWWIWVAAPIVVIAALYRRVIDLARRCRRGNEYAFDSAARTLTHNGGRAVLFQSIDKVIFHTFRVRIRGSDEERYSLRLLLADGSKIQMAALSEEKPVADLANQVADFMGKKVEKVYEAAWDHESIKSLDLTQRQLDRTDRAERGDDGSHRVP